MAVRVERCKASGDCRADAHNLAEISPQHLARRLVIYTPTAAEIDELMDKARRDLPEIGANEAVHRVVRTIPIAFGPSRAATGSVQECGVPGVYGLSHAE